MTAREHAPRTLLLGCNGQVGWELQRALAPLGEVIALDRHGRGDWVGDLAEPAGIAATVRAAAPDAVINAAAYTAVDRAESEPGAAHTINAEAPAALAEASAAIDALLVHYSTDYVFNGSGERPWRESDPTAPVNVYGETKRAGEQAIRESGCRQLVLRTSWVYAARGHNFIRTMLRLAGERDALSIIDDQHGAPTGAELIADVTAQTLRPTLQDATLEGVYHLAAGGEASWYDYARYVIDYARQAGTPINVHDEAIAPAATSEFPRPAPRPLNSRLDTANLEHAFGLRMPDWRHGVARAVQQLIDE